MSSLKKRLKKYLLFPLLTFLILFLLLELTFILLEPYLFKGFYQFDPDIGFKVRPYHAGTNRFGFNDYDWELKKEPDTFRILFLGDSFSWSLGQDWNYTALIRDAFDLHFDEYKTEVINAGYPMSHTGEQLVILKKYALQYQPDLVVLSLFVGNDFIDVQLTKKRIVLNDSFVNVDKDRIVVILGYPLIPRSRLFLFLEQKFKVLKEMWATRTESGQKAVASSGEETSSNAKKQPPKRPEDRILNKPKSKPKPFEQQGPTFSKETYLDIENRRMSMFDKRKHEAGDFPKRVEYIFNCIKEMKQLLNGQGIRFMVVIIPDEFQVNESLSEEIFARYDLDREHYDMDLMQDKLGTFLASQDVPYIDLLPVFRERGETTTLYKIQDSHWNLEGNKLAAEIIYPELVKQLEALRMESPDK